MRQRLKLERARRLFKPTRVDTQDVDFSDRINGKRISYRVRSGKRRQHGQAINNEQSGSSDDEPETVDSKIARLLREVEEVKGTIGNAEDGAPNDENETDAKDRRNLNTVLEISNALKEVQLRNRLRRNDTPKKDVDILGTSSHPQDDATLHEEETPSQDSKSLEAQNTTNRILAKATDLESRLTSLETILGSTNSLLLSDTQTDIGRGIIPLLSILEAQFATLTTASLPSLEALSAQIDQLTKNAAQLEETRNAATRAAEAALKARALGIKPSSTDTNNSGATTALAPENLELAAKIDAMYSTLPTIEAVTPLLPAIIERLKTLRTLHAEAATAEDRLAEVEQKQRKMGGELVAWREGLEKVEGLMKENDTVAKGNKDAVEVWVQELEQRMRVLK